MTYAVVWRENEGAGYSGRLELWTDRIVLSGSNAESRRAERELPYDHLVALSLERRSSGRGTTQAMLVLWTRDERRIEIASLDGLGALRELAEHVESARGKAAA